MLNLKPPDSRSIRERIAAASGLVVMLNLSNESLTKGAASLAVRHSSGNWALSQDFASGETARMTSEVMWIPFPPSVGKVGGGDDEPFFAIDTGDLFPTSNPSLTGCAAAIVRRARNTRERMLKGINEIALQLVKRKEERREGMNCNCGMRERRDDLVGPYIYS